MSTPAREYDKLVVEAVHKVAPSVVSIAISKYLPKMQGGASAFFSNPFQFGNSEGVEKEKVKIGGGSGFVVTENGLILTNKHVVMDPEAEYTVMANDLREYPAKVLSRDPVRDIALLKIEKLSSGESLPAVKLGDSHKLQLGQTVIAIGNALGMFSNSVSKGIISGLARSISASLDAGEHMEHLRGVIQTDVAINQGNSGGPLINLDGEAIAINTAVIFGAQNIGFSIPIDWAKSDLDDIKKHGRIIKPYIGLMYFMLNKELQTKYALPVDHGALVLRDQHVPHSMAVIAHSPADKAGIKENDIITAVDGKALAPDADLSDVLQSHQVGDTVAFTVLRKDNELNLALKLEERKIETL